MIVLQVYLGQSEGKMSDKIVASGVPSLEDVIKNRTVHEIEVDSILDDIIHGRKTPITEIIAGNTEK